MTENDFSYVTRIGNTTFIVNIKKSKSAKKPLNTVFQDICKHEVLSESFLNSMLNLENKQKSS